MSALSPLFAVYSIHVTSLTISPLLHQLFSRLFFSLPVFSCLLLDSSSSSSEDRGPWLSAGPSLITCRVSRHCSPLCVSNPSSAVYNKTYLPLSYHLYTGLSFYRNKLLFNSSKDFRHLKPKFCGDSYDTAPKCCQLFRILWVAGWALIGQSRRGLRRTPLALGARTNPLCLPSTPPGMPWSLTNIC